MKCKFCGSETFVAHQACYADILVDSDGEFKDNMPGGLASAVYEASKPYGPYDCNVCGAQYEELEEDAEVLSEPSVDWKKAVVSPSGELLVDNEKTMDFHISTVIDCGSGCSYKSKEELMQEISRMIDDCMENGGSYMEFSVDCDKSCYATVKQEC